MDSEIGLLLRSLAAAGADGRDDDDAVAPGLPAAEKPTSCYVLSFEMTVGT